jgi:putative heme iron utilization protein
VTAAAETQARRLLRRGEAGMLATASLRFGGHPYASVVRYALDGSVRPVLLVSRLAEHTRNLESDPRASLLVTQFGTDAQADARVTMVGRCVAVPQDDPGARRYLRRFPDAAGLLALGDFAFLRIEPLATRFIAGFGSIHWLPARAAPDSGEDLAEVELDLLARADPAGVAALWRRLGGDPAQDVTACGIDADGIELRGGSRLLRADFPEPARGVDALRAALAELLDERVP